MANDLRVVIVATDPLARSGLASLLAEESGCTVLGQVDDDTNIPDQVELYRPDVLVWDLGWDPTQAIDLLTELRDTSLPPIVALVPNENYLAEVWSAGARGVLLRDTTAASLLAAVRAVSEGLVVLARELSSDVSSIRSQGSKALAGELTPREMEVLLLLAEGLPNKSIAHRLAISEHTVKFHVNAILGKLNAQSRTEAVTIATRLGLILL